MHWEGSKIECGHCPQGASCSVVKGKGPYKSILFFKFNLKKISLVNSIFYLSFNWRQIVYNVVLVSPIKH